MYNVVIYNSVVSIDLSILFRVWCLSSIFKAAVIANFCKQIAHCRNCSLLSQVLLPK